ncbi:MAG: hypothetical protein OXC25_09935 [Thiotrichales bacterium]|nr:hypothetical protein [Thiotrichales bacterium]
MKHAHIGLVALAAMVIAGCGGGSSKTNDDMPEKMEETKPSTVDLKGVTGFPLGADGTLTVTLEPGDEEPGPNESKIKCAAGDDPCVFTVAQNQFGALTATYMGGKVTVTPKEEPKSEVPENPSVDDMAANGDDDEDDGDSSAQGQPSGVPESQVKERVDDARDEGFQTGLAQAEARQRAPKWLGVLDGDEENGEFSFYGTASTPAGDGVRIEHERSGSRKVEPDASISRGSAPPTISGFTGASFVLPGATHEGTLYLYDNLGSPNTRPFWKVHGEMVAQDEFLSSGNLDSTIAAILRSAKPRYIRNGSSVTSGAYDRITIAGSFDGVSGTFTCLATDCAGDGDGSEIPASADTAAAVFVSAADSDGIRAFTGTWIFEPSSVTAPVRRDQDEMYLYFGLWTSEPEDPDGMPDLEWIRGGGLDTGSDLSNFAMLDGKATFEGGAIGQYAIDKTATGGEAKEGIFTAKATLDAVFTTNSNGTLSGRIGDFQDEDGSPLTGWQLYLGGASNADTAELTNTGVAEVEGASGKIDGVNISGSWQANLYGVDNGDKPESVTSCPNHGCEVDLAGVTGRFRADGAGTEVEGVAPIVAIGGAFGAAHKP